MLGIICTAALLLAQDVTPVQAMKKLTQGNVRFASDTSACPDRTSERRSETVKTQEPFAAIVACSDSRVAPEIIFDQGIGDLFIVRVAGNVVGSLELNSIEYSALVLHSSLILVLGHENCGAVNAVLHGQGQAIPAVAALVEPAVKESAKLPGDPLVNAIQSNVEMVVQQLKQTPSLMGLIKEGKLDVRGGYYNFHTGRVEILD